MNGFNEGLRNLLEDVFEQINVTEDEKETMKQHYENSKYSTLHVVRAWREDEILCVGYDDGHWFRYRNGEWW